MPDLSFFDHRGVLQHDWLVKIPIDTPMFSRRGGGGGGGGVGGAMYTAPKHPPLDPSNTLASQKIKNTSSSPP